MKANVQNELIKRDFLRWLLEAGRSCESTVRKVEQSILLYQELNNDVDFRLYNPDRAISFKKALKNREYRGKRIALTTYHSHLRNIRKFFLWLTNKSSYKSKITPDLVDYLKVSAKEQRIATQETHRDYPTLNYVKSLCQSIDINSEVDTRDRAIIAFTLLSGIRVDAMISLKIGSFDKEKLIVDQNPSAGVRTKNSKRILTVLFEFDDKLLQYFLNWHSHILGKGFEENDPLFPRSKLNQGMKDISFQSAEEVERLSWNGTGQIRNIFKTRSRNANLPYHSPHSLRHLAVYLALKYSISGEQLKAISQNFGHEYVATTLSAYANYGDEELVRILMSMKFKGEPKKFESEILRKIKELLDG